MKNELTRNNVFFRQLLFMAALITIAVIIFKQLHFFFGAFLGAFTIYVVLRDFHFKLTEKKGWKPWLSSLFMVILTTIVLLALGFLLVELVASEISVIDTSKIISDINDFIKNISSKIGFKILPENILSSAKGILGSLASSVANTTYSFAANIFMMIMILYFMFMGGRKMERSIIQYIPFSKEQTSTLKSETKKVIYSNAIGMPLILIIQAIVASFIYWIMGINGSIFWGFLTAICGLLPVVGCMIIYVPIGIFLMLNGHIWQGIIEIAYGLLVISNIDNLLRIVLMKKMTNTHPLIVIFGVVLGIPLFGFWGIIFGPLLISGFFLLVKMYYREYRLIPEEESEKGI